MYLFYIINVKMKTKNHSRMKTKSNDFGQNTKAKS